MTDRVLARLDGKEDLAVALLRRLMRYESVASPQEDVPGAPQGAAVAACLGEAHAIARELGLYAENADGWAVLISPDERKGEIGILCHLDVVPAGDGWRHDPLAGTVEDGILYGRGACDDKGPFVSALLALRALKECKAELKLPVTLIAGSCEETGSADIAYLKKNGLIPKYVFSPDAYYPVVNTEKGILRFSVSAKLPENTRLKALSGGDVINKVPPHAEAILQDGEVLFSAGTAAHASTPEEGENAISLLLDTLAGRFQDDAVLLAAHRLAPPGDVLGAALGIAAADELSGALTCNLGLASLEDGVLTLSFDVRSPVCLSAETMREKLENTLASTPFKLTSFDFTPPHHVPADSPFVSALLAAYTEATGKEAHPQAMGGATYVHYIEGGVAFGALESEEDGNMHCPEEYVRVSDLIRNAGIFARAILKLQTEIL